MNDLFHFTCGHHGDAIARDGYVRPASDLTEKRVPEYAHLAWFTDLDVPIRDALGLTRLILACDRTERRFRVLDPTDVYPWVGSVWRRDGIGLDLELADGARPMHWFVSAVPVPVIEA